MRLNTLKPASGSKKKQVRVGRGWSSGVGKTCGRGMKGQKARNTVAIGFEGGQMPLQMRLPKFGFNSWRKSATDEIRLHELNTLPKDSVIDLALLSKMGLISKKIKFVKIINNGDITIPVTIKGLKVTKGAAEKIQAAGGKIEE